MRTGPTALTLRASLSSLVAFGVAGSFAGWTSWWFAGGVIGLLTAAAIEVAEVLASRFAPGFGLLVGACTAFAFAAWSLRGDSDAMDALFGRTLLGTALSGLCLMLLVLWTQVAIARRDIN